MFLFLSVLRDLAVKQKQNVFVSLQFFGPVGIPYWCLCRNPRLSYDSWRLIIQDVGGPNKINRNLIPKIDFFIKNNWPLNEQ